MVYYIKGTSPGVKLKGPLLFLLILVFLYTSLDFDILSPLPTISVAAITLTSQLGRFRISTIQFLRSLWVIAF